MRLTLIAAVSALAIAACAEKADDTAAAPEPAAAETGAMGHDMATMDHDMATMDTADDASTAETPDGYTFHTYPARTESVHLPAAGEGSWSAASAGGDFVKLGEAMDMEMPDGVTHYVMKVETLASGNADVVFERRDTPDASGPVVESRTVHFMIH